MSEKNISVFVVKEEWEGDVKWQRVLGTMFMPEDNLNYFERYGDTGVYIPTPEPIKIRSPHPEDPISEVKSKRIWVVVRGYKIKTNLYTRALFVKAGEKYLHRLDNFTEKSIKYEMRID